MKSRGALSLFCFASVACLAIAGNAPLDAGQSSASAPVPLKVSPEVNVLTINLATNEGAAATLPADYTPFFTFDAFSPAGLVSFDLASLSKGSSDDEWTVEFSLPDLASLVSVSVSLNDLDLDGVPELNGAGNRISGDVITFDSSSAFTSPNVESCTMQAPQVFTLNFKAPTDSAAATWNGLQPEDRCSAVLGASTASTLGGTPSCVFVNSQQMVVDASSSAGATFGPGTDVSLLPNRIYSQDGLRAVDPGTVNCAAPSGIAPVFEVVGDFDQGNNRFRAPADCSEQSMTFRFIQLPSSNGVPPVLISSWGAVLESSGPGPTIPPGTVEFLNTFDDKTLTFASGSFPRATGDEDQEFKLVITARDGFDNTHVEEVFIVLTPASASTVLTSWTLLSGTPAFGRVNTAKCEAEVPLCDLLDDSESLTLSLGYDGSAAFDSASCLNQDLLGEGVLEIAPNCLVAGTAYNFTCTACLSTSTNVCQSSSLTIQVDPADLQPVILPSAQLHAVSARVPTLLQVRLDQSNEDADLSLFSITPSVDRPFEFPFVYAPSTGSLIVTPAANATGDAELCATLSPGGASVCTKLRVTSDLSNGPVCAGVADGTIVSSGVSFASLSPNPEAAGDYLVNVTLGYCGPPASLPPPPDRLDDPERFDVKLFFAPPAEAVSGDSLFLDPFSGGEEYRIPYQGTLWSTLAEEIPSESSDRPTLRVLQSRLQVSKKDPKDKDWILIYDEADAIFGARTSGDERPRGRMVFTHLCYENELTAGALSAGAQSWGTTDVLIPLSTRDSVIETWDVISSGPLVRGQEATLTLVGPGEDEDCDLFVSFFAVYPNSTLPPTLLAEGPGLSVTFNASFHVNPRTGEDWDGFTTKFKIRRTGRSSRCAQDSEDTCESTCPTVLVAPPTVEPVPLNSGAIVETISRDLAIAPTATAVSTLKELATCTRTGACRALTDVEAIQFRESYGQVRQQIRTGTSPPGTEADVAQAALSVAVAALHEGIDEDCDGIVGLVMDIVNNGPAELLKQDDSLEEGVDVAGDLLRLLELGTCSQSVDAGRVRERLNEAVLHALSKRGGDGTLFCGETDHLRVAPGDDEDNEDAVFSSRAAFRECISARTSGNSTSCNMDPSLAAGGVEGLGFQTICQSLGLEAEEAMETRTSGRGGSFIGVRTRLIEEGEASTLAAENPVFQAPSGSNNNVLARGTFGSGTPGSTVSVKGGDVLFEGNSNFQLAYRPVNTGTLTVASMVRRQELVEDLMSVSGNGNDGFGGFWCGGKAALEDGLDNDCDGIEVKGLPSADGDSEVFVITMFYDNPGLDVTNANVSLGTFCEDDDCFDDDGVPVGPITISFCVKESDVPTDSDTTRHRIGLVSATKDNEFGYENNPNLFIMEDGDADGSTTLYGLPVYGRNKVDWTCQDECLEEDEVRVCGTTNHLSEFTPALLVDILQIQAEFLWTQYLVPTLIGIAVVTILTVTSIKYSSTHKEEEAATAAPDGAV